MMVREMIRAGAKGTINKILDWKKMVGGDYKDIAIEFKRRIIN